MADDAAYEKPEEQSTEVRRRSQTHASAPDSVPHTVPHVVGAHDPSDPTLGEPLTDRLVAMPNSGTVIAIPQRRGDRRALIIGAVTAFVGIYFLWQVQEILPPFIIAIALAALLDPTIRHFQRRGRSRIYAIVVLYLFGLCLVGLVAVFAVPSISDQVNAISKNTTVYYNNFQRTADAFLHHNERILGFLGIHQKRVSDFVNQKSGPLTSHISSLLGGVSGFVSAAASKAIWLVIIPIAAFFLMRDYPVLRGRMLAMFPEEQRHRVDVMSREIVDVFITYLRGLVKICVLYGIAAYFLFLVLGIEYALFLAIMAGLFYTVPYIGPIITALVTGAVAYSMEAHTSVFGGFQVGGESLGYAFAVVGAVIAMNQLFDNIVFPRVVGESIGLHPVVSIFALMAGATLFSVWGMLLAMPVAASIQIVLMYFFPKMSQPIPPELIDEVVPRKPSVVRRA